MKNPASVCPGRGKNAIRFLYGLNQRGLRGVTDDPPSTARLLRAQYLCQCPGETHDDDESNKTHAAKVQRMGVGEKDARKTANCRPPKPALFAPAFALTIVAFLDTLISIHWLKPPNLPTIQHRS